MSDFRNFEQQGIPADAELHGPSKTEAEVMENQRLVLGARRRQSGWGWRSHKKGTTTMADRFLSEVKRMHQLRQDINEMTPEEADELIRGLGDDAAEDWVFAARDAQLPPP